MKRLFILMIAAWLAVSYGSAQTAAGRADITDKAGNKAKPIELTKAEFLKKVADFEGNPSGWKYLGDKPAIVDFYTPWCGPCISIAPTLKNLAKEYSGEIYVYKINADKEKELTSAFGIHSFPTLLFIPMHGQPQMAQGALPKKAFKEAIGKLLLNQKNK